MHRLQEQLIVGAHAQWMVRAAGAGWLICTMPARRRIWCSTGQAVRGLTRVLINIAAAKSQRKPAAFATVMAGGA